MDFAAFNYYMISEEDGIVVNKVDDIVLGYEIKCKYPTYRGAYLCNVLKIQLFVDGKEIPEENLRFDVNGKSFLMEEITDQYKEYWFTGAKAALRVIDENGIAPGEHKVKMLMHHKIPYTGYFGTYLELDGTCEKTLTVK
ncbi:MAG: DUF6379 domain-containing protein [Oscillospiraceae bacterium]|nr:DUF6379 domain-containing protein [Oscillospiraceae bacterium]